MEKIKLIRRRGKTMSEELRKYIESRVDGEKLSVINMLGGAVLEGLDIAIIECVENMADINYKTNANRQVVLKINMKPLDDSRTLFHYDFDIDTKRAKREPVANTGTAEIRVDGANGVYAKERNQKQEKLPFEGKVTPIRKSK
jgi:hypothetical protein